MIRHGDVYLIPTKTKPSPSAKAETKDMVVALGEATGHRHELYGGTLYTSNGGTLNEGGTALFVADGEKPMIAHRKGEEWTGEHGDIELTPGTTYEVRIQRQWTPSGTGWENVAD